ncbi:hypothetical protein HanIR_Chr05g0238161 [Helianthus annuus]|nr:hypothetical protein HanIR_Chr05g0238161 [Helianthus annuus]
MCLAVQMDILLHKFLPCYVTVTTCGFWFITCGLFVRRSLQNMRICFFTTCGSFFYNMQGFVMGVTVCRIHIAYAHTLRSIVQYTFSLSLSL